MFIKQDIAQYIVDQLKDIIGQHLNFITIDGKIIASTDPNRIGTYHEAAVIVTKNNNMVITEYDGQHQGARKGINMPLNYKNEVIGVIGITGKMDEVLKYGEIIQKMAEILILENYAQSIDISNRERDRHIIIEILNYNKNLSDSHTLRFTPFQSGQRFRTLILEINLENKHSSYLLENLLKEKFGKEYFFYLFKKKNLYYILTSLINQRELVEQFNRLNDELILANHHLTSIGVGSICHDIKSAHLSFVESKKALKWAQLLQNEIYSFYEDLDLGVIGTSVPPYVQKQFSNNILSNIPLEEFEDLKNILYIYGKNNRSIRACSEELYMHKNTFQYQLNKIEKYTNYDPKNIEDYMILKLAFLFYDLASL